jgi:WhiB family redox-sensing transcriptional regulator
MLVRARAVCADCGVRQQCLEFAMATNQDCGVWGGTSEDERRDLRRRAAAARRASPI